MAVDSKMVQRIGWIASLMAIAMYVSYLDQIRLNLAGQPGSTILPIVTIINCASWTIYAALKTPKDWPIIACNVPGIIIGFITMITAMMA